jgi:hypothetical protein
MCACARARVYMCVCARAWVRGACMCVRARGCVRVCVCVRVRACLCKTLIVQHTRHDFREKFLENEMFLFSLQLLSKIFLNLRRNQRDIIINVHRSSVKYPLFLSHFNQTWPFSTDFRKILKYEISWKSVQWESNCFMRTDGRTYRHDDSNSRFSQFCERA